MSNSQSMVQVRNVTKVDERGKQKHFGAAHQGVDVAGQRPVDDDPRSDNQGTSGQRAEGGGN